MQLATQTALMLLQTAKEYFFIALCTTNKFTFLLLYCVLQVYFARDASYSAHTLYSKPDGSGIQRMFLCQVAVGDWCRGSNGQLTPDVKVHRCASL